MYRIVAYYYAANLGGFQGPTEVYRDARRHVCQRYCHKLRKLARLSKSRNADAVYFVRHVRHTPRGSGSATSRGIPTGDTRRSR